jgi:hypothetical protein
MREIPGFGVRKKEGFGGGGSKYCLYKGSLLLGFGP